MMDWGQIIGWLNKYDRSHLDDECVWLFEQISYMPISKSQREYLINDVIRKKKLKRDILMYSEVLLLCSDKLFNRKSFPEVRNYLNDVVAIYSDFDKRGRHRLFVTLWLLGIVEWKMANHYAAYENWKRAQEIVKTIIKEEKGGPFYNMVQWYEECEEEMKVNLAGTAEETYTWINKFEPSSLSSEFKIYQGYMVKDIKAKRFGFVYESIQKMREVIWKRSAQGEKAEVFIEFGLALHQMHDNEAAEKYIKRAVQIFFPHAHEVAVARWMLGIIQWKIESKRSDALNNWRKSITDFRLLLERANKENNKGRVKWYTDTCEILEKVQAQRIPYV